MNERQLEVQKAILQQESDWQQELKAVYNQAAADTESKIRTLAMRDDMENLAGIVYQKTYQDAICSQLEDALEDLDETIYTSMSEYLEKSYEDGFLGTLYDLQGQGIPLVFPIEQDQVIQAIQLDSKISQGLYTKLGEDVDVLKKTIQSEVSTGIANGSSWNQMATMIAKTGMNSRFSVAYNRSILIARTEAHRIQQKAALDCQYKAKEKGAEIRKVWDSTMDSRTRPTHVSLDGQIREVEEAFEVGGKKAMYPGGFGSPDEDCNCRCCLLQKANWELTEEEYTKMNGDTNELVKIDSESYNDFKQSVNSISNSIDIGESRTIEELQSVANTINEEINDYVSNSSKWSGNIAVDNSMLQDGILGQKEWNCDITVVDSADDGVIWHEMLHSCSSSYTSATVYYDNAKIEEAAVEFLKMQICDEKGIASVGAYSQEVSVLQNISSLFSDETDLEFAQELFNVSLSERYEWLENTVDTALKNQNVSFEDYNEVMEFVKQLKGGYNG